MTEKQRAITEKHAAIVAAELQKAKKQKKWRGDGKGNLIENRAVDNCIQDYKFIHGREIVAELGLSMFAACDQDAINESAQYLTKRALEIAKAKLWTAA